jgi:hypothetical protein
VPQSVGNAPPAQVLLCRLAPRSSPGPRKRSSITSSFYFYFTSGSDICSTTSSQFADHGICKPNRKNRACGRGVRLDVLAPSSLLLPRGWESRVRAIASPRTSPGFLPETQPPLSGKIDETDQQPPASGQQQSGGGSRQRQPSGHTQTKKGRRQKPRNHRHSGEKPTVTYNFY